MDLEGQFHVDVPTRVADSDEEEDYVRVDGETEEARAVVTEFVHLLDKSKNLFNGLR